MKDWYQSVRCGDGYPAQEYLFGTLVNDTMVNNTMGFRRLSLMKTLKTYQWDDGRDIYPNTWNYNLKDCKLIFKGE